MVQSSPNLHGRAQLVMDLRGKGIANRRVLEALEKVPREDFVDAPFAVEAYTDRAIPIACGQTISQPYIVAYMSDALDVGPRMRVLEIGTGSGYQAAVLAHLAGWVYSVERHRPLLDAARKRLEKLKLHNVVTRHGDGFLGWKEQAPFDRILLTAAVEEIPKALIEQLKPGGLLIAPVARPDPQNLAAESIYQYLTKIIRSEQGFIEESLIKVLFVPMVAGLPQETRHGKERLP
ncbi:MAG: protein-L-isoaspartate(D-aspartate) O-methyltransferase [Alphaproteobacteria bacterium]|nr:protein-L-isoaspartate(D-aspartate) O-methyltransferase [Alphaproteobacteria bacterium]